MTELIVGIKHLRDGIEPQNVLGAELSVVGLIGTAPGADADVFPLNQPIYLATNDLVKRAAIGTTGTVPQALTAIAAQVAGSSHAAKVVVVLVADNASPTTVIANIIGNEANGTGMWAFLDAPEELGVTPRLIIAPGYTSQADQGVVLDEISAPGSGGTDGTFALAFTGGTGTGAAGTFTVTSGAVTAVTITSPGVYTAVPTLSFAASTGLTGATATLDLEQLANGVCAAIPTVLERLRAIFLPEGPTNTRQAWLDWKETLPPSARIQHPLRQSAKILDANGDLATAPLSPFVIGLYPRRDSERDGIPSGSVANQPIYGLVGVEPAIRLSLTDETSPGQIDLADSAGIVVRGETGVESALGASGFIFWGTDSLSPLSEWLFTHVNRLRDYMELGQVQAEKAYLGRFEITVQTVQAVLNTLEAQLSQLRANRHILDYRISFEPDANSPEELRAGQIDIAFQAEEPPVLRKIIIRSRRHREALEQLVQQISVQIGSAAEAA